jgi:hypothetical protein
LKNDGFGVWAIWKTKVSPRPFPGFIHEAQGFHTMNGGFGSEHLVIPRRYVHFHGNSFFFLISTPQCRHDVVRGQAPFLHVGRVQILMGTGKLYNYYFRYNFKQT